jgi:hypothetical protein
MEKIGNESMAESLLTNLLVCAAAELVLKENQLML